MAKILVIEDEISVRETLLDLLELENFEVISAENGEIGLRLAQEQLPDLVICDVSMPALDGYGVLELLRQNPKTAGIPLIFLTARAAQTDFRQGMRLGADDYITKPFTQAELLEAIATRLTKYAATIQPYVQASEQATAELNEHLHFDRITRLPTCLLLQERFHQLCTAAGATADPSDPSQIAPSQIAILGLSIDRFDRVRSSLDDANEDRLLRAFAQRLLTCVSDRDTVARLGEDQFAILLVVERAERVDSICQTILDRVAQPLYLEQQEVFLTVSIGIAYYAADGELLNDLMRKAAIAMHYGRTQGGNQYQKYAVNISSSSREQVSLETSLRHALERNEFQVYYQPQVNLQTGVITGAEALIRWHNPERGIVSPAEFIPLAEEIGLIRSVGEWVLQMACQQTQIWRTAGFPIRIAVNLSGQQFNQPDLVEKVTQTLQMTQLDPTALELELTESILLQNRTEAITTLNQLKALGIQIAIDDFGTGYASLSYLKQFPFDTLKIDRCFIHNVHSESYNNAITTAVLQMANQLNLKVVAEGVETAAELEFLCRYCCQTMQGFLFSRPLPAAEFEALLKQGHCLAL